VPYNTFEIAIKTIEIICKCYNFNSTPVLSSY